MKAKEILTKRWDEWIEDLASYWVNESSWADEELARAERLMEEERYDDYICQFTDESFEWSELAEWIAEELYGQNYSAEDLERIEDEIEEEKLSFFRAAAERANELFEKRLRKIVKKYNYVVVNHATKCDGKPAWWLIPESWK